MSIHELHPEELIDKAARGSLDASERTKLDRHLSACAVCRFETRARADFRANEKAFSDDAIDAIVGASLRGADAREDRLRREAAEPRAFQAGSLRSGKRWAVLLAVAVLLVSAQATARWFGIHVPTWLASPAKATVTIGGTEANGAQNAPKLSATPKATAGSEEQPTAVLPIPETPNLTDTTPKTTSDLSPRAAPHSSHETPLRSTPEQTPEQTQVQAQAETPTPIIVANATASALFTQANADRTQGHHMVATREYRELLENYPNAPEADLSRATLGRLMLDDGDAMGALPLLNEYLRKGGTLREETMVNRATALERLHRVGEESAAWRALLDAYPQSLHAERARQRLEELDAR
jgi:TolA-binding protein